MVCLSREKVFICYHCQIVSIHNLSHYPRRLTRFVLCLFSYLMFCFPILCFVFSFRWKYM